MKGGRTESVLELEVLDLIVSLDRYEVKVVRDGLKDAGVRHSTALKLFDIIRSSKTNDRAEMRRLAEQKGISKYHRTCKHLRELIVEILKGQVLSELAIEFRVWRVQSEAMVYWYKGFKEEAISHLRKGIDEIRLEDHPEHVLTLLVAEERMIRSSDFNKREERHARYRSERNAALKILQNREAINDLSEEAFQLRKQYHSATHPEVESKVRSIIENPLLQNEMGVLSFAAKIRFHVALSFCYSMLPEKRKTLYHHQMVQKAWEERPDQQALKPRTYQQAIINNISVHVRFKELKDVEKLYEKARSIVIKDKAEAAAGFYALSNVWLFYLINNRPMDNGLEFASQVEDGMEKYKDFLDDETIKGLRFNLADLMYLSDNLQDAIRLFRTIPTRKDAQRKDLQGIAKMMVMLLSFDRDSPAYIDSMNKEARRYFRNNPEVDTLNGMVYETIGKLLSTPENEEAPVLQNLSQGLQDLEAKTEELAGLEEVKVWLNSKLTGKSYGTVWQEQLAV